MLDNKTFLTKIKAIILKLDSSSSFNPKSTIDDQEALSNENFEYGMNALENSIPSHEASAADDVSYDNTDSGLEATNVQDAIDELAESGGGGSSSPDIYVSCSSDVEPTKDDPIVYTTPVFGFGDTIENIITKLENGSLVFAGKHKWPGEIGDMFYKMDYESIGVIPKATLEAAAQAMSLNIVTLSDAINIIPYISKVNINNNDYTTYQVGSWSDGFIFYTDGDETHTETYGKIVRLITNP